MRKQFSIYMDEKGLEWLQDQVRKGRFKSVSEGIRESVTVMRNVTERLSKEEMNHLQT
ncbi:ribbon-helix-helix domain-containing protein [Candidatus Bathyarchaeota archaeon]|nr:ribbon-helix-helix domain-containing protein [Candidatus Bathyarchaeota archaeon]